MSASVLVGWPDVRGRRLGLRLARLYLGLVGFGVSLGLMVRAGLGLGPWDVLHQGIAQHLEVQLGWVTIAVSGLVLLAWIPLRQRPGLGTLSNAVLVGLVVNASVDVLSAPESLLARVLWLAAGVGLNGLATACYIGANLGPGARDGLMTGLAARGYDVIPQKWSSRCESPTAQNVGEEDRHDEATPAHPRAGDPQAA